MSDEFSEIEPALHHVGISTYRQRPHQLVLSRQPGPAWPDAGNSFWLCKLGGDWYVCTWAPCYYRVTASVLEVAEAFTAAGETAQPCISPELVARFGLVETDDETFDRLWEAEQTSG